MYRLILTALLIMATSTSLAQVTTEFTYQGKLEQSGTPANGNYDFRFSLWDNETAGSGTQLAGPVPDTNVTVEDGLFTADIDFGSVVFGGQDVWLQIEVAEAGTGTFTTLGSRQQIKPTPMAQHALQVPWSGIDGVPADLADGDDDTTYSAGAGLQLGNTEFAINWAATDARYWKQGGNAGMNPSADFLGTTDSSPLEMRVNNKTVLQIFDATDDFYPDHAPNVIMGSENNALEESGEVVEGATIVGGGGLSQFSYCGPDGNGTCVNTVSGDFATVVGGQSNYATDFAAVAMGYRSNASGSRSIAMGGGSDASGDYSIAIGESSDATGLNSMAVGRGANALHDRTFVWSHSAWGSTAANQFLVRADGGAGFGTNAPSAQLHAESSGSGLATPTLRAENLNTGSGVAGYFTTHGSDVTMALENLDGSGPLLKGFGNNGGGREFEIRNDGSMDFFNGANRTVNIDAPNGNINIDGSLDSTGADFAEMLPRHRPEESIRAADLVAVRGGEITRITDDAERLMIISSQPAVLGNHDASEPQTDHSPVAFLGQVPVRVRGPVAIGDLLVASGRNDGTARAVSPAQWDPDEHGPFAGHAWSTKSDEGLGTVTARVGAGQSTALVERIRSQKARIDSLENRLARLERALEGDATLR